MVRGARLPFVALALGTVSLALFARSIRWRVLLTAEGKVPVWLAFWATAAGYFGNNVLPARAGEVVRSLMISRYSGFSKAFVLTTALSERVVDAIVLISVSALVLLTLPTPAGMARHCGQAFRPDWLGGSRGHRFSAGIRIVLVPDLGANSDTWRASPSYRKRIAPSASRNSQLPRWKPPEPIPAVNHRDLVFRRCNSHRDRACDRAFDPGTRCVSAARGIGLGERVALHARLRGDLPIRRSQYLVALRFQQNRRDCIHNFASGDSVSGHPDVGFDWSGNSAKSAPGPSTRQLVLARNDWMARAIRSLAWPSP